MGQYDYREKVTELVQSSATTGLVLPTTFQAVELALENGTLGVPYDGFKGPLCASDFETATALAEEYQRTADGITDKHSLRSYFNEGFVAYLDPAGHVKDGLNQVRFSEPIPLENIVTIHPIEDFDVYRLKELLHIGNK